MIKVEQEEIIVCKDQLLQVDPGEKYKVLKATKAPFFYLVVCTSKEFKDKVVVE